MEIPFLIFACVTLGLLGSFLLVSRFVGRPGAAVRRRLKEQFRASQPSDPPQALFKHLDVFNLSSAEEYAMLGRSEQGTTPRQLLLGLRTRLEHLLQEANVPLRVGHVLALSAAVALGLALGGGGLLRWPGALAGAAAGAALPLVFLHFKRKRRRRRFVDQLPKAFDLMARVIRAGQSVPQAFQAVADAFEEPLAGEFLRCQQQQNLGLPPEVVFQEMAKRCGVVEFRLFVLAMLVQRQVGGNLSEVLDRLAGLIRARQRLRQQVRTLTAEGRLQGLALVVLPFIMFAALFVLNRPYAVVLLDHAALLWATAALMVVGVLWIRHITNVEG